MNTAWLVELPDATWWTGDPDEGWTRDSLKAVRYPTEMAAHYAILEAGWTTARPTEHAWVPAAEAKLTASPTAPTDEGPGSLAALASRWDRFAEHSDDNWEADIYTFCARELRAHIGKDKPSAPAPDPVALKEAVKNTIRRKLTPPLGIYCDPDLSAAHEADIDETASELLALPAIHSALGGGHD